MTNIISKFIAKLLIMYMKVCTKCGMDKTTDNFYIQWTRGKKFFTSMCKPCTVLRNKERSVAKRINGHVKDIGNEKWEWVTDYENYYMVSDIGRVKGVDRWVSDGSGYTRFLPEKLLNPSINQDGYMKVILNKESERKTMLVNQLVGRAFVQNPDNLPVTNHKNAIRSDNRAVNLEWCTVLYNCQYKYSVMGYKFPKGEKHKFSKKIQIIHPDGKEEVINGILETSRRLGIPKTNIGRVLQNIKEHHLGYKFKYA